jgi:hypothetical protein
VTGWSASERSRSPYNAKPRRCSMLGSRQPIRCGLAGKFAPLRRNRKRRARVVSIVGYLVGRVARAFEASFVINRLYEGSSPLLGTNFKDLQNIYNVFPGLNCRPPFSLTRPIPPFLLTRKPRSTLLILLVIGCFEQRAIASGFFTTSLCRGGAWALMRMARCSPDDGSVCCWTIVNVCVSPACRKHRSGSTAAVHNEPSSMVK